MMLFLLFSVLLVGLAAMYVWAFRSLPRERWQFLAAIPVAKLDNGRWSAVNVTFYGFFAATACVLGGALFLGLAGSIGIPSSGALAFLTILVVVGTLASRFVNRVASGTRHGFTVGGSALVGLIVAPMVFWFLKEYVNAIPSSVGVLQILAAMTAAYALGEGVGRWGCVSFGCCYGKPVVAAPKWLQPFFTRANFIFEGGTKKAVYESGLENQPLIPVQGLSAIVLTLISVISVFAFWSGYYRVAFLISAIGTQGWRILSEYLRQDERTGARWRRYQGMAICTAGVAVIISVLAGQQPAIHPDPQGAWLALYQVPVVVILQAIWWLVFIRMGLSQVTGCDMAFFVREERI